jgi:polysaccharide biosynthesis protein PslH
MKIGLLTTRLFASAASGGERCTQRLLEGLLALGHEVEVAGLGDAPPPQPGLHWHALGPLPPPFAEWPAWARVAHVGHALLAREASTTLRQQGRGAAQRLRGVLARWQQEGLDALLVDHLQAWPGLAHARAGAPALPRPLLLMHNLESAGYARLARGAAGWRGAARQRFLLREARLLAQLEDQALAGCAALACLSEHDAAALAPRLRALANPAPVLVLPGYPPLTQPVAPRPADGWRQIGLIGSWTWGPNRAALDWMLARVLPLLPPCCRLVIAGGGLDGLPVPPGSRDRVRVLGRVPSPADLYAVADVVAVPSVQGSGVQEKAIEAIASGRPVVATPHALRGLGAELPPQVHAVDDAALFAHLCATVTTPGAQAGAPWRWAEQRRRAYFEALQQGLGAAARQPAVAR